MQQRRAFFHALFDVTRDPVMGQLGHDRAHLGGQIHAVQHFKGLGARQQFGHQSFGHVAHQYSHTDGHTAFASGTVSGTNQGVDGLVDIGIGHHHHVVLGAAQCLHAFAVVGAGFIDVIGNGRGADKTHGLDVRVHQQCVNGFLVALHHVEDAIRQASLLEQVGHQQAGAGVQRAGLQHKGVARSNGDREHPHRHHDGEVERRDAGHHTQRLAQRPVVDAGAHLVGEVTLEQLRNAASKFDDVDTACHFTLCIGKHLAMLGGDQPGQIVLVGIQQLQKFEHHPGAANRRCV